MSEIVKERKDIEEKDKWDLSSLFKSDEEFEDTLKKVSSKISNFKKYEGPI